MMKRLQRALAVALVVSLVSNPALASTIYQPLVSKPGITLANQSFLFQSEAFTARLADFWLSRFNKTPSVAVSSEATRTIRRHLKQVHDSGLISFLPEAWQPYVLSLLGVLAPVGMVLVPPNGDDAPVPGQDTPGANPADWMRQQLAERNAQGLSNYPLILKDEAPALWALAKEHKAVLPSDSDGAIYVWSTAQLKDEMRKQYAQKKYDEAMVSIVTIDEDGPIGVLDRMSPEHQAINANDFRSDRQRQWVRAVLGLAQDFMDFSRFIGTPIFALMRYLPDMPEGSFVMDRRTVTNGLVEWVGKPENGGRIVAWAFGKEKTEFIPILRGRPKPYDHEDLSYSRISMPRTRQLKKFVDGSGKEVEAWVYDQIPNKNLWHLPGGNMYFVTHAVKNLIDKYKGKVLAMTNSDMCDLNSHVASQHLEEEATLWIRDEDFKDVVFGGSAFTDKLKALQSVGVQEIRRIHGKEQLVNLLDDEDPGERSPLSPGKVEVFIGEQDLLEALGVQDQFKVGEKTYFMVDFVAREIVVSKVVSIKGTGRDSGLHSLRELDRVSKIQDEKLREQDGNKVEEADHGGFDQSSTTGHSGAKVPMFAIRWVNGVRQILNIKSTSQADVAPTLMQMMKITPPTTMKGQAAVMEPDFIGNPNSPTLFQIIDGYGHGEDVEENLTLQARKTGVTPYFRELFEQAPNVPEIPSAGKEAGLRGGAEEVYKAQGLTIQTRKSVIDDVTGKSDISTIRLIETDVTQDKQLLFDKPEELNREQGLYELRERPFLNDRKFIVSYPADRPGTVEIFYFDPIQLGSTEFNLATFGAGSVVEQDILLLDRQFKDGSIFKTDAKKAQVKLAQDRGFHPVHQILQEATIGVHASKRHLFYEIRYFKSQGVKKFVVFGATDGRDENKTDGVLRIEQIEQAMAYFGIPPEDYVIHVGGREIYYDRAERYDLTEQFLNILKYGSRVIRDLFKSDKAAMGATVKPGAELVIPFIEYWTSIASTKGSKASVQIDGQGVRIVGDESALLPTDLPTLRSAYRLMAEGLQKVDYEIGQSVTIDSDMDPARIKQLLIAALAYKDPNKNPNLDLNIDQLNPPLNPDTGEFLTSHGITNIRQIAVRSREFFEKLTGFKPRALKEIEYRVETLGLRLGMPVDPIGVPVSRILIDTVPDSRSKPGSPKDTLRTRAVLANGTEGDDFKGPSGKSTGRNEATHDANMTTAVPRTQRLADALVESKLPSTAQRLIDSLLEKVNGRRDNATLAVSLSVAKAAAKDLAFTLAEYITRLKPEIARTSGRIALFMNIFNGGVHANNGVDIQEFMLVTNPNLSYREQRAMGDRVYSELKVVLAENGFPTDVIGDEGGFAPKAIGANSRALEFIAEAMQRAGVMHEPGKNPNEVAYLALDVAASSFHHFIDGKHMYMFEEQLRDARYMVNYYKELKRKYPYLVSIEDGLAEDDWEGWQLLTAEMGVERRLTEAEQQDMNVLWASGLVKDRVLLVGDDLYVTQQQYLQRGIETKAGNSLLVKFNQAGLLTETLDTIGMTVAAGFAFVVSHRSGETNDTTIADIAFATKAIGIKTGAPRQLGPDSTQPDTEDVRRSKYVRLDVLEQLLGTGYHWGLAMAAGLILMIGMGYRLMDPTLNPDPQTNTQMGLGAGTFFLAPWVAQRIATFFGNPIRPWNIRLQRTLRYITQAA